MEKWDGAITSEAKAPPRQPKGAVLQGLPKAAPQQSGAKPDEDFGPDLFTVLDIAAIRNLPDPQWLVKGMIIERSLSLIHGVPGAGKSFVALSLALSIASAQPQWWERPIERSGRVAYISSEGVADMRDRIAAFEGYHHLDLTDAGFLLLPDWISFMESEHLSKLARTLDAAVEAGPLALIVVDTVSRVLPGADENLQADMTQFIRACDILRERYQCAVLGIHHSSRQGNLRGSTVLDGAADSILGLERIEGEVRKGRLLAQKIKAAEDGWETPFDLHVVPLDPLKGTQSLAAAPAGGPRATHPPSNESGSGGFSGGHRGPDRGTQSAILRAVQEAFDAGDPWSSFAQSQRQGRYLPALMRRWGISPEEGEVRGFGTFLHHLLPTCFRHASDKKAEGVGRVLRKRQKCQWNQRVGSVSEAVGSSRKQFLKKSEPFYLPLYSH
jgi:KaiC/GvpD/RAD55 family RecA-like ATPase